MFQRNVLYGSEGDVHILQNLRRWLEVHTTLPPTRPSTSLWQGTSPQVRDLALNRTYERLDEHEREVRETLQRLEAEVYALREPQSQVQAQENTHAG